MDDGGDIVSIIESARRDEAWEQGLDVVVVGFGAAEFCGERPEGFGLDRGLGLLCGLVCTTAALTSLCVAVGCTLATWYVCCLCIGLYLLMLFLLLLVL